MIRMLSASTGILDDTEEAVKEIINGLYMEDKLLKNSVGIIICANEHIGNGAVKALCASLPFDAVGFTSMGSAISGSYGFEQLTLCVLTSDDVEFVTAASGRIREDFIDEPIAECCRNARKENKTPNLIIAFAPLIYKAGTYPVFNAIKTHCGEVPLFGAFATELKPGRDGISVIRNGEARSDMLSLISLYGDISPRLKVVTASALSIQKKRSVVSESETCIVKKIDNMLTRDYLTSLGLIHEDGTEIFDPIPFLIAYPDGTTGKLTIYSLTEEGYGIFGDNVPVGSTLTIGAFDANAVIESCAEGVQDALDGKAQCLLMFSCIGRNFALDADSSDEMKKIAGYLDNKLPYFFIYAGGEICPVADKNGNWVNRFHNFSFITCAF